MTINVQTESEGRLTDHAVELTSVGRDAIAQGPLDCVIDGQSFAVTWSEVEPGVYSFLLNGRSTVATVRRASPGGTSLRVGNKVRVITVDGYAVLARIADPRSRHVPAGSTAQRGPLDVLAPMPGRIVKVLVSEHSDAREGEGLMIIEAMKMQNEIRAPRAGTVAKLYVAEGTGVEAGARLIRLE